MNPAERHRFMETIILPWDLPETEVMLMRRAVGNQAERVTYMEHFNTLDQIMKIRVGYLYAALESLGRRDFRRASSIKSRPDGPIEFRGWGGLHNEIGPCFRIEAECFLGRKHLLYYTDDDLRAETPNDEKEAGRLAADIALYSSGLADIRVEAMPIPGSDLSTPIRYLILFRLDPTAVRPEVIVNGESLSLTDTGGYILVLPKAGEFQCDMGELVQSDPLALLPLYRDSFCMK